MNRRLKIGDKVVIKTGNRYSESQTGRTGIITADDGTSTPFLVEYDSDKDTHWFSEKCVELINNNKLTMVQKIGILAKKLLSSDTQDLIKAGFLDNATLELTPEGVNELNAINFDTNKAALVTIAQAKNTEEANKNK